jgi:hypothetical protein
MRSQVFALGTPMPGGLWAGAGQRVRGGGSFAIASGYAMRARTRSALAHREQTSGFPSDNCLT